jgi:hypothetical protein
MAVPDGARNPAFIGRREQTPGIIPIKTALFARISFHLAKSACILDKKQVR